MGVGPVLHQSRASCSRSTAPRSTRFVAAAAEALARRPRRTTMLTPGIHASLRKGRRRARRATATVRPLARGARGERRQPARAARCSRPTRRGFLADARAARRGVRRRLADRALPRSRRGRGGARRPRRPADRDAAARRGRRSRRRASCSRCSSARPGRILANGWPTGVEVEPRDGARRPLPGDVGRPHAPRSARWRSTASCARSATRTCPMPCCPRCSGAPARSAFPTAWTVC